MCIVIVPQLEGSGGEGRQERRERELR